MIVTCTRCEAKFRVADERVGPRGAKVRCSRCQEVFLVHRDFGTVPAAPPPPAPDPFARSSVPEPDPFAARSPAPAGDDPFARPWGPTDPFAASAPAAPPPAPTPAPAAAPSAQRSATGSLPLTDLSQLLGEFTPRAGPPPLPAPPPPFAPPAAPAQGPDPFGAADPFAASAPAAPPAPARAPALDDPFAAAALNEDPFAPASSPPDPFVAASAPEPFAASGAADPFAPADPFDAASEPFDGGPRTSRGDGPELDIEDPLGRSRAARGTPDGALTAPPEPSAPPPMTDPLAFQAFDPDPGAAEGTLSLATDPTPAAVRPADPSPPPPPARPVRPAPPAAAAPPTAPAAVATPPPGAVRGLRGAAVNALSLVALVGLALAFRVVWRGQASADGALRPSGLVAALRGAPLEAEPFTVRDVAAAVYPQADGGGILYVRGEVVPGPGAPRTPVRVQVELWRGGRVLARAEAAAGAVASPEALHAAVDRAALDRLTAELDARAPAAAGSPLPFLVPVPDAPADLGGTSVRVQAAAAEVRRP